MADPLVFYYPRHREDAEARAERIGGLVRSLKGWNGYVEEEADLVVVDNDAPDVAEAYRAEGAEVEWLYADTAEPVPEPEPEPEPVEDEGPILPDGYTLEQSGSWFKVIDADGEQVGNAKRDPDEAIAQVVGE